MINFKFSWSGSVLRAAGILALVLMFIACPSPTGDDPKGPNKADLISALADADAAKAGVTASDGGARVVVGGLWVPQAAWDTFNAAISAANEVRNSGSADQIQVDEAAKKLREAINAFKRAVQTKTAPNKSGLESKITGAENLLNSVIPAESAAGAAINAKWATTAQIAVLNNAINAAKSALDAVDQSAVADAINALDAALSVFNTAVNENGPGAKTSGFTQQEFDQLKGRANTAIGEASVSADGTDVLTSGKWVTQAVKDALEGAINAAPSAVNDAAYLALHEAVEAFNAEVKAGSKKTKADLLAEEINAISHPWGGDDTQNYAGTAVVNGDTVKITSRFVYLIDDLTVPAGVTLDVTEDGAALGLHDMTLTVDGTVNAGPYSIGLEDSGSWGTIKGSGTINLKGKGALLWIEGNHNVANRKLTLDGVTLVGVPDNHDPLVGVSGGGPGRSGEFVMKSGAITGNTNRNDGEWASGGGVGVYDGGRFSMEGGAISGNTVQGTDGGSGGGVDIWDGTFTMTGGTISGNTANQEGGGVRLGGAGALFTMEGGEIKNNTATVGSDDWAGGGGVRVQDGARFELKGGAISGNSAQGTDGGSGGGVDIWDGTFTMTGGTITGNTTNREAGGVMVGEGAKFTMSNGAITNNTAANINNDVSGGGVRINEHAEFTMNGGEISYNTAKSDTKEAGGGGVHTAYNGTFTMNDGKITNNTAQGYSGRGGGGVNVETEGVFTMQNGEISGNWAISVDNAEGGGVKLEQGGRFTMESGALITGNTTQGNRSSGGGVRINEHAEFTMNGGEISNNTVISVSGQEWAEGGGVWLGGEGSKFTMESGAIITNNTTQGNRSNGGGVRINEKAEFTMNGGTISYNTADGDDEAEAGGVWLGGEGAKFTMQGGEISNNTAEGGHEGAGGGGVEMRKGTFTMTGGKITNNTAKGGQWADGGGIRVDDEGATFTMQGGEISNNTAEGGQWGNGGGVFLREGAFNINGGAIKDNKAIGDQEWAAGGGVKVSEKGTFTMQSGEISGNRAISANDRAFGGGVTLDDGGGTFLMISGTISGNTAEGAEWQTSGGGVRVDGDATFIMQGGEIKANKAIATNANTYACGGGVQVNNGSTFTMEGGTISENEAKGTVDSSGGGVKVDENGTFIMERGTIYGSADASLTNLANRDVSLDVLKGTAKWGTGGTYTGGESPTSGGDIVHYEAPNDGAGTNDTLKAVK